jgi:hypothetical protein
MQLLLDSHRDEYDKADRFGKTVIVRMIIQILESRGGRFLKFEKNQNIWVDVPDKMARDKVSHAMRDNRKKTGETPPSSPQSAESGFAPVTTPAVKSPKKLSPRKKDKKIDFSPTT